MQRPAAQKSDAAPRDGIVTHFYAWQIADDLCREFPDMKGFSASNLKYMRRFAEKCSECKFGQQPADQLPWFHIVQLLTKVAHPEEREWYARKAIEQAGFAISW